MPLTCFAILSAELLGSGGVKDGVVDGFFVCDIQLPSATGLRIGCIWLTEPLPRPLELLRGGMELGDLNVSDTIFAVMRWSLSDFYDLEVDLRS